MPNQNRQLAAILFTDIVSYTAMMQQDEQKALAITRHYLSVLKQSVQINHGKILNDYGDGSLCTFSSVTDALHCAIEVQQQLQSEPNVPLRIGLHSGEVFFEENKVMGDSVNVASRIQSLGEANTILFSREIFDKIKNQPEFKSVSLGRFEFKNVDEPMEIFALANDGLIVPKREQMEGKLKEVNKISAFKKLILVAVVLFLLGAGFFLYKQFFDHPDFSTKEKSIAILPFTVIGNNADNTSQGLVEDILVHLSKISELTKVISNRSSSKYADTKKSPAEIGEELNVNSLVTGSIQQIGDTIRVSAQLIDSKSGNILWADNYTRGSKQIFDLETELAIQIVNALKAKLTPTEEKGLSKHYTENVEAYRMYRRGRFFWDQRTKDSYDSAELYYKKAIDLDPDYALAYSGLADCYTFNQKGLLQTESIPIARDYANKALSLDSTLTEALTTHVFIQSHYDYDWKGAVKNFERIIQANPNYPIAHLYYGNILLLTGNSEAGLAETKKALSLDPLSLAINHVLGRNYFFSRKYDSAIAQLQKTVILNQKFYSSYEFLGMAFIQKKNFPKAIDAFSKLPPGIYDVGFIGIISQAYGYAFAGDKVKAMKLMETVPKESLVNFPTCMAYLNIAIRNYDEALNYLDRAYQIHDIALMFLKMDPTFDPLRNEPRFKALSKKMNLTDD